MSHTDEECKIAESEPYTYISEAHQVELGYLLNDDKKTYNILGYHLGLKEEVNEVQNKINPGYEILKIWSRKGKLSTIRVLSNTFKMMSRVDLKEKLDEFRLDNMILTLVIYEDGNESNNPISETLTVPSKMMLVNVLRPTLLKYYQSFLKGRNIIIVCIDGYDAPWNDCCSAFKGCQVNVRIKKETEEQSLRNTDKKSGSATLTAARGGISMCAADGISLSDYSPYRNSNPDKHYIKELPGFFEFNRDEAEIKLRQTPERKYILRYRVNATSENDSHLALSIRFNAEMWHFLIFKRINESVQFYLFSDGCIASSVQDLLSYYQINPLTSSTVNCPECTLDGPAI